MNGNKQESKNAHSVY